MRTRTLLTLTALCLLTLAACTLAACSDAPRTSFSSMEVAVEVPGPFAVEVQDVSGRRAFPARAAAACPASPCVTDGGALVGEARSYYVIAYWPPDSTGRRPFRVTEPFVAPDLAGGHEVSGQGIHAVFYP